MAGFETTLWTRIDAVNAGDSLETNRFVTRYRAPLLRYLGRRGLSAADAEDVGQEVFLRLLTSDLLARADRERGRFRAYLLGITHKVLLQRRERAGALKRGGGRRHLPLEEAPEPVDPASDELFQSCWAEGLLGRALEILRRDNPRQHELIRLRLHEGLSLAEIGARTGRSAAQVKSDHHRAKQRLARLIKDEVRAYCSSHDEYAAELVLFRRLVEAG